jgi:hypothetical protein
MANKNLVNLLKKLQEASFDQKDGVEALSDSEAEEIAGGSTDVNIGCPQNTSCGPNKGCGGSC